MTIAAMKAVLEFLEQGNFVYPAKIADDLRAAIEAQEKCGLEIDSLRRKLSMRPPTILEAEELFTYDPESGVIAWKVSPKKSADGRAGTVKKDGYLYIRYQGKQYLAHRIAFYLHHGKWPSVIDHINGVKIDNRISNLREASVAENNRNRGIQSNNTSGYKGVSYHKATGKYHAKIQSHGKPRSLGYFDTPEDAYSAYVNSARQLHGEFCGV